MTARPGLRRLDTIAGVALLALAALAWAAGTDLPVGTLRQPGPGLFPRTLTAALAVLATLLLARGALRPGPDVREQWEGRAGLRRPLLMVSALVLYVAVVSTAGYLLTTGALVLVMVRWVGGRGWVAALLTSVLVSAGSYLLFARALSVNLPTGQWLP